MGVDFYHKGAAYSIDAPLRGRLRGARRRQPPCHHADCRPPSINLRIQPSPEIPQLGSRFFNDFFNDMAAP